MIIRRFWFIAYPAPRAGARPSYLCAWGRTDNLLMAIQFTSERAAHDHLRTMPALVRRTAYIGNAVLGR